MEMLFAKNLGNDTANGLTVCVLNERIQHDATLKEVERIAAEMGGEPAWGGKPDGDGASEDAHKQAHHKRVGIKKALQRAPWRSIPRVCRPRCWISSTQLVYSGSRAGVNKIFHRP